MATWSFTAWDDEIPIGIIYRNNRPSFESQLPALAPGPLCRRG